MQKLFEHEVWQRVTDDQPNAFDRQWLAFLTYAFENVSHAELVKAGMDMRIATEVLGLIALNERL